MKTNKRKEIALLIIFILLVLMPLVTAAPLGTSESSTVTAAKSWIGVKNEHGGNNSSIIDCSHLVYQVYKEVGATSIVFQTVHSMKKNKYYVTTTSPRPGDVIFWKKNVVKNGKKYSLVNHVGIYTGNNQFVHTSDETGNVTIDNINGMYKDGKPYYAKWNPVHRLSIQSEKRVYFPIWEHLEGTVLPVSSDSLQNSISDYKTK